MRLLTTTHHARRIHWAGYAAVCLLLVAWCPFAAAQDAPVEGEQPEAAAGEVPEAEAEEAAATGDEAEQDAGAAGDQVRHGSELASAERLGAELDVLLQPDGQLDTTNEDALVKLENLATRCGILANSSVHPEARMMLLGFQARALAALASLESRSQDPGRLDQLKEVAEQIGKLEAPGAKAMADYWSLPASLSPQASAKASPTERQANAEQVLADYIDAYRDDEHAAEYLLDTRLSLAQLMDRRGAQRDADRQIGLIGKLPPDSPRLQEMKHLRESIGRLGSPIRFESLSTRLVTWRSSDHLGKPVLIHVYADSVEPSVRMIDVISRSIVEGTLSGIAVVSLRVGDPIASTASPPWPTLPVQLEEGGVLDQLGVTAIPTLAWLDSQGQLASIGTTPAVLDQFGSIKPEPVEEDPEKTEPQEPATGAPGESESDESEVEND